MSKEYEAIIVGGGVIGGAIAYNLAKRGKKVLLLEKDRLASQASSAAAGMLAAQAELSGCGQLFPLAKESRRMFPFLEEEIKKVSGVDIQLVNKGTLKPALTEAEEIACKQSIEKYQEAGEQADWLTAEQAKKLEPNLSCAVRGAMYIKKDGHVSAPHLTRGFLYAAAVLGADIFEYEEVLSLQQQGGEITGVNTSKSSYLSPNVIIAGGAWSDKLLKETEAPLNTYPVKGECFSLLIQKPLLSYTIFSDGCYLVPKSGGRIIVGATVKQNTFDRTVTMKGIYSLMDKAKSLVPVIINAELEKAWAGIRPQTADALPYLGEHPALEGLFVATGHYRNGILLSPITGEVMADLVEKKTTGVDLTPFRLERNNMTSVGNGGSI
ncbi:glycine oxidase ThiO [Sediminibacillus albus]|uniref:glycine oxidase n=1 Tax=Sediminibacillus albus TaxID=407036 RepID=A0A1G8VSC9_9BACI|nr:glycine oxidase ThiO [Sediminibacillus albus]SDJ68981.1 glycine oxidase [Sediminibacillus albus]